MDAVARVFREACPTGTTELAKLREALLMIAQEKISSEAITSLLDEVAKGAQCIEIDGFLDWLAKKEPKDSSYFAGVSGSFPQVNQLSAPAEARFGGSIEDFRVQFKDDAVALERLQNSVKVCKMCGKPCAFTLSSCNACGASLKDVQRSFSDNIFMGFIYGIAKGKFPYKISMRAQTPDFLCFDDPLQCSSCHLNAIPTSVYCCDMRYLFTDPSRGLALILELRRIAAEAALEQYWKDEAYREKVWNGHPRPEKWEDLTDFVVMGFNFPPSMFQLHLQFIHLPLLPFHYSRFIDGEHFTYRRFFPLEYMQQALARGDAVKMAIASDTDISDIIDKVKAAGVDYDVVYAACMERAHAMQRKFAPWKAADFCYRVSKESIAELSGAERRDLDPKEVQKSDAVALQNYGRPYDENGKPTGTYYKYAKDPKEVASFAPN
eukprot:s2121_g10.t1